VTFIISDDGQAWILNQSSELGKQSSKDANVC